MFTDRQQRTLTALCRRIAPAAHETAPEIDLPHEIVERLAASSTFNQARVRQALNLLGSPAFGLMLTGRAAGFASLTPAQQDLLLARCEHSRLPLLRLLFDALKRLIVNTWYGLPTAGAEVGYPGPLTHRKPMVSWEGALEGAAPVVAERERERVRERVVPERVFEAGNIDDGAVITTEFCVIGSGVGGAVAACVLSEAGRDVVMLEAGAYRTAADHTANEGDAMRNLYAEAGLRATDDLSMSLLQARCAGGGSTINWMVMLRTPDYVLEEWARRHGVEDISPQTMREVFTRFENETGVGPVAEHAHSRVNRILLDGARALGWRVHGANVNARECMRSGLCGLGCPYDAKQGMLKTHLARALEAGATLYCNARAERISASGQRKVVHAVTSNGRRLVIHAERIIVAAGAVETPALLQRSGIGNPNVGSHLRLHPTTAVVGVYDEPVFAGTGIPLSAYCDEFTQLRGDYGHWIETPPFARGLAGIAMPGFGEFHRAQMRQYPYLAPLIILVRDGSPDDPSQGSVRWQRSGRARIAYRLSDADRAAMLHGMESAARIHFAMGARSVFTLHRGARDFARASDIGGIRTTNQRFGDPMLFSAHVNGTCRVSASAREGACNPDGSVRGHDGIYVMDGSLLPTAPGVNPHESIAGFVTVLANRLIADG